MAFGFDEAFSIGSSLFDAALGHYESVRDQHFQSDEAKAQRVWQQQENQRNRDWQEKMYLQYNTPSAMKQQFRDAGYNPYLMMSQNQMGNGMSASPPSGSGVAAHGGSLPPGSRLAENYLASIGVQANAANQQAKTVQQEWETYQFIREHVGSDAAKKYLEAHPEMVRSNSPDNDPWMRSWILSYNREQNQYLTEQWEYNLKQLYGVKQAEIEMYYVKEKTNDLLSQIDKRSWDIKEIRRTLSLIDEKIKTEKSVQSRNYAEGRLAVSQAETNDQTRMYVVRQFLLNTNILDFNEQTARSIFESKESLRGWLTSAEAKEAFARVARNHGLWDADAVRSSFLEFLDHTSGNYFGGFSGSDQRGFSSGSVDSGHSVNGLRFSNMSVTY